MSTVIACEQPALPMFLHSERASAITIVEEVLVCQRLEVTLQSQPVHGHRSG